MSEDSHWREDKIVVRILAYVKEHPQAKDTLEGISKWWLGHEETGYRADELEHALSRLVSRDLLVATQFKGSPPCYAANPKRLEEISRILKDD